MKYKTEAFTSIVLIGLLIMLLQAMIIGDLNLLYNSIWVFCFAMVGLMILSIDWKLFVGVGINLICWIIMSYILINVNVKIGIILMGVGVMVVHKLTIEDECYDPTKNLPF